MISVLGIISRPRAGMDIPPVWARSAGRRRAEVLSIATPPVAIAGALLPVTGRSGPVEECLSAPAIVAPICRGFFGGALASNMR